MIIAAEYAPLGFTEVVILESRTGFKKHDYDKDSVSQTIIGLRDGKYVKAYFFWTIDKRLERKAGKPKLEEITAEEYASLKKQKEERDAEAREEERRRSQARRRNRFRSSHRR